MCGSNCKQISDDSGLQITFDEMRLKTIRAAQNLKNFGCRPKDVFGIIAKNTDHLAPIVFALFCLGCPPNIMDASFAKVDIVHMMKITKPRLIFCDVEVYPLISECLKELQNETKIFTFGGQCGNSEAVGNLFAETGTENSFL